MSAIVKSSNTVGDIDNDLLLLSEELSNGSKRSIFSVSNIRCGGCVAKIENALVKIDGIDSVRANLTLKRLKIDWTDVAGLQRSLVTLKNIGFEATLVNDTATETDESGSRYLRATAVAGFSAGNIMMLSVAIWAGADEQTQNLFHTVSAFLAVLTVVYSGSIFFASAWSVLIRGRTNMDVPISVGIILAVSLGLYDTVNGGADVYFEAATMLIFFLLVGRTLDESMRRRAKSSLGALSRIEPRTVVTLPSKAVELYQAKPDNAFIEYLLSNESPVTRVAIDLISVGDHLLISTGARLPLDSVIVAGSSDFDTSIVDGEALPKLLRNGDVLDAGIKNLGQAVVVKVINSLGQSFLRRTQKLVEGASLESGHFKPLSERVVRWYAPFVHTAALSAGLFWFFNGADLHQAITIAIAVLIITCPCALGLAVPMVQVLSGAKLFKHGVVMKNGTALERVGSIDTVVFDKTGTLTQKTADVLTDSELSVFQKAVLYRLASDSTHPYARSIYKCHEKDNDSIPHNDGVYSDLTLESVIEVPGKGIEGTFDGVVYRLGKIDWAGKDVPSHASQYTGPVSGFSANGIITAVFRFSESLRNDSLSTVELLQHLGCEVHIASGDKKPAVVLVANLLGVSKFKENSTPAEKSELIKTLKSEGKRVMMVGDGINDTVALSVADVSIAMGDAGDISASCADFVLMHNRLESILILRQLAKKAQTLMHQNITFAIIYNLVAMPLAFAGLVSPLIAAIAMSTSSLLVIGNSLRLNRLSKTTMINGQQSHVILKRSLDAISLEGK